MVIVVNIKFDKKGNKKVCIVDSPFSLFIDNTVQGTWNIIQESSAGEILYSKILIK